MRRWITALIMAGMAGAGVVAAAPAAVAASPSCLVLDTNSNQSYPDLSGAVAAAAAGDTLLVKGTCPGGATITTSLTITGNAGAKTATLDDPHLLIVRGITVTMNNLVLNGGSGPAVNNEGTVTLNGVSVTNSTVGIGVGGPVFNEFGTMTLNNSMVSGNANFTDDGGGIYSSGGRLTLNRSTVTGNTDGAHFGGGIGIDEDGTATLNNSSVTNNTGPFGGGIGIEPGASVTLNHSTVTGNTATKGEGGGIYNHCGTLNGAVSGTGPGGNVYNNTPDDIFNAC